MSNKVIKVNVYKANKEIKEWFSVDSKRIYSTNKLINFILKDDMTRTSLILYKKLLEKKYTKNLDGISRIKWNALDTLLSNGSLNPVIQRKIFDEFLYSHHTYPVKTICFQNNFPVKLLLNL